MPRLVPQHEHERLNAFEVVNNERIAMLIDQRDCVENMVRNLCNLAFLFENGDLRPGVAEKLTDTPLGAFYSVYSPADRVSDEIEVARYWLDCTLGFAGFGVEYDPLQGGREVLTGLDNITALITAMLTPVSKTGAVGDGEKENADANGSPSAGGKKPDSDACGGGVFTGAPRAALSLGSTPAFIQRSTSIMKVCNLLSSSTMKVVCNRSGPDINNFSDIALKFQFIAEGKTRNEKVKLLITTDHVCTRHGDEFAS